MTAPKRTILFDPKSTFRSELENLPLDQNTLRARRTLVQYDGSVNVLTRSAMRLVVGLDDRNRDKIAFGRAFLVGGSFAIHAAKPTRDASAESYFATEIMTFFSCVPNLYNSDLVPSSRVDRAEIIAGEALNDIPELKPLADTVEAVYERPDLPHLRDSLSRFALYGLTATASRLASISEMLAIPALSDLDKELAALTFPDQDAP